MSPKVLKTEVCFSIFTQKELVLSSILELSLVGLFFDNLCTHILRRLELLLNKELFKIFYSDPLVLFRTQYFVLVSQMSSRKWAFGFEGKLFLFSFPADPAMVCFSVRK